MFLFCSVITYGFTRLFRSLTLSLLRWRSSARFITLYWIRYVYLRGLHGEQRQRISNQNQRVEEEEEQLHSTLASSCCEGQGSIFERMPHSEP